MNDDFCDCELDGADEPRTGACLAAPFTCDNWPHVPLTIPASRVNDGLCDCCDVPFHARPLPTDSRAM